MGGFSDFMDGVGDGITNTLTLGNCDGGGCGSGHGGTWGPLAILTGKTSSVTGGGSSSAASSNPLGISSQQIKQLATYGIIGIGGFLALDLVMTLLLNLI